MKLKKKPKVAKASKLWDKAGKAMQDYYRTLNERCIVETCKRMANVRHHWASWKRSTYLRFNEKNLVPLCKECHCKFHAGDIECHRDIQIAMSREWGNSWEEEIIRDSHKTFKLSAPELRDYLNDKIEYYNNLKNA